MKSIKKVTLINFQSHKKTELDFDNGLNIIVGPSDSGKTAIIRGIKWALYNDPVGDFFIKKGEKECSVEIVFSDNIKVKRYRSASKNMYQLTLASGESMEFEGFGHGVPDEISRATGISQVELDSNISQKINLAEQLEGAFLLSESDYVKANSIGRLVGVNIVDDALKKSISDLRGLTRARKDSELRQEKIKEELKSFEYLEEYEKNLNNLKLIRDKIVDSQSLFERLENIHRDFEVLNSSLKLNEEILYKSKNIERLETITTKIDFLINKKSYLESKLENLNYVSENIKKEKEIFLSLDALDMVQTKLLKIEELEINFEKLNDIYINKNNTEKSLKLIKDAYSNLKSIDLADGLIKQIDHLQSDLYALKKISSEYSDVKNRLSYGEKYTQNFNRINKAEENSSLLADKIDLLKKLEVLNKEKDILEDETFKLNKYISKIDMNIESLLNKYGDLLSQQESCPLCFSNIDSRKIEDILETYREEFNI